MNIPPGRCGSLNSQCPPFVPYLAGTVDIPPGRCGRRLLVSPCSIRTRVCRSQVLPAQHSDQPLRGSPHAEPDLGSIGVSGRTGRSVRSLGHCVSPGISPFRASRFDCVPLSLPSPTIGLNLSVLGTPFDPWSTSPGQRARHRRYNPFCWLVFLCD